MCIYLVYVVNIFIFYIFHTQNRTPVNCQRERGGERDSLLQRPSKLLQGPRKCPENLGGGGGKRSYRRSTPPLAYSHQESATQTAAGTTNRLHHHTSVTRSFADELSERFRPYEFCRLGEIHPAVSQFRRRAAIHRRSLGLQQDQDKALLSDRSSYLKVANSLLRVSSTWHKPGGKSLEAHQLAGNSHRRHTRTATRRLDLSAIPKARVFSSRGARSGWVRREGLDSVLHLSPVESANCFWSLQQR